MKWHSLEGRFRSCPKPPYLVDPADETALPALIGMGYDCPAVTLTAGLTEQELVRGVGAAAGFPPEVPGGWDGFFDYAADVAFDSRFLIVSLRDADVLAAANPRLFVRLVWLLMRSTELVERRGDGAAQLEYLFWGTWDWAPARGL